MPKPPQLRIEYVRLQDVKLWPTNPKAHDVPELIESYDRFGFAQPLLYDEGTQQLVAGHGRLEALQRLKDEGSPPPENIEAKDGDWLVPVVRGVSFKSGSEAEAFLLASNEIGNAAGYDKDLLMSALKRQQGNLKGTGFTQRRLAAALREQHKSTTRKPSSTRGIGEGKPSFTIEFANEDEKAAWLRLIALIERTYPVAGTLGARLVLVEAEFAERFSEP